MSVACGHGFILDCSPSVGLASVARSAFMEPNARAEPRGGRSGPAQSYDFSSNDGYFAPSDTGSASRRRSDFTMPCVPVLYLRKWGVWRCAS